MLNQFVSEGNSMFYLFQLTSQWSLVPLFPLLKARHVRFSAWCFWCAPEASPFICVSFTLFYIYSGWVIVAVMTGTVSFTMISFKERMVQDDESREEEPSCSPALQNLKTWDVDVDDDLHLGLMFTICAAVEWALDWGEETFREARADGYIWTAWFQWRWRLCRLSLTQLFMSLWFASFACQMRCLPCKALISLPTFCHRACL